MAFVKFSRASGIFLGELAKGGHFPSLKFVTPFEVGLNYEILFRQ